MQKEDKAEQPEADKRKEWDYHLRHQQWLKSEDNLPLDYFEFNKIVQDKLV